MAKLAGKVALVTGAADGLGAAISECFAAEGAVVVVSDIHLENAQAVANRMGNGAVAMHLDVCAEDAWQSVMNQITDRFGHLDILVNNAGGAGAGNIEDTDIDFYRNCMRLNIDSTFIGCQLAVNLMKGRGGNIINISSVHGIKAAPHAAAYTAAKGAVRMLTKSIAVHCGQFGLNVRCNSIHPGYIGTTQMLKWVNEQADPAAMLGQLESMHPIGRLGEPEDVAKAALFLASDDAKFVTGAELVVDGGFSCA